MVNYICETCNKLFKYKYQYNDHMLLCTNDISTFMTNKYLLKCTKENCNSVFNSLNTLNKHIQNYHSQKKNSALEFNVPKTKSKTISQPKKIINDINVHTTTNNIHVQQPVTYEEKPKPHYISKNLTLYWWQRILTYFIPPCCDHVTHDWLHFYPFNENREYVHSYNSYQK